MIGVDKGNASLLFFFDSKGFAYSVIDNQKET
jgi:hypothetical protein